MKAPDPLHSWKEKLEGLEEIPGYYKPDKEALYARFREKMDALDALEASEKKNRRIFPNRLVFLRYATAAVFLTFFILPIFHNPPGSPELIGKKVLPVIKDKTENKKVITPVESGKKRDSIKVDPGKVIPQQKVAPVIFNTNDNQHLAVDNPKKAVNPDTATMVHTPEPVKLMQPAIAKNELPTIHTNEMKDRPVSTVSTIIFVRKIIKQQTNQTAKANHESFEHTLKF